MGVRAVTLIPTCNLEGFIDGCDDTCSNIVSSTLILSRPRLVGCLIYLIRGLVSCLRVSGTNGHSLCPQVDELSIYNSGTLGIDYLLSRYLLE